MRVLIIEDEVFISDHLRKIICQIRPDVEVVGQLCSVEESIVWLRSNHTPDLIFQDIELKDGNCFAIYQEVEIDAPIVLTTAYSKYALQSFDLNSIAYLLKPFSLDDLKEVFIKYDKFRFIFDLRQVKKLKEMLQNEKVVYRQRFLFRIGDSFQFINVSDVAYFYSDCGLSFALSVDGERFPLDQSLVDIAKSLDPQMFFQISRQCILNISSIKKIHTYFSGRLKLDLIPEHDFEAVVSRDRVKAFKQWLSI
ncbi:MAG: LytR/AlgR family response regulator transcription factor [Bacteroidales bacterium]